jgi:redox-sensitive bicupin YhaK (pirin superfamily)
MIPYIRRSAERGHVQWDWLQSRHTFSFGDYIDPKHTHFRQLRVINEDVIAPGRGFGTHPHRDMEIITYVVSGQLAHRDSMGNERVVGAGEVQAMSAGAGVEHSEFNPSSTEPVHLLQIWIFPEKKGIEPRYVEWRPGNKGNGELTQLASRDGAEGSAQVIQDVRLYLVESKKETKIALPHPKGRYGWAQVISGEMEVAGETLKQGDGMGWLSGGSDTIISAAGTKALVFDLV